MPRLRPLALRRLVALAVVIIGAIVFSVRLIDVQIVSAAQLNADALDKRGVPVSIPSVRGDIVDRNGVVLATTDERYDVQLSPRVARLNGGKFWREVTLPDGGIDTVQVTAEQAFGEIGAITGQSAEEIATIVDEALAENPKSDFAYVKRAVDLTTLNALKQLDIGWLTFDINHQRLSPTGAVGGNIVGFSGADGEPQAGIALSQQECLTGVDGEESYEKGADGVRLPGSVVVTKEAQNGGTIQLTLDIDLQYEAQQIINAQTSAAAAEWGLLTIMDAETGELVAVAEDYSVDPNDVSASDADRREARSFTWPYEPGSTYKAFTAAMLVDQGAANAATQHWTSYQASPEEGVYYSDAFVHEDMPWTLAGILVESSNVGITALGARVPEHTRYEYMQRLGLGEATDVGMPAESAGLLYDVADWDRQTSYATMFGQGLSSTIVQTASAYQAIANDGVRIPPSLVMGCTSPDGEVTEYERGEPVQVFSADTAAQTREMIEAVANEAWIADQLAIPGYRIGGKTGTAEQSDGEGGYRTDYVYTFAGMFPLEDPKYVAVATIAYPKAMHGTVAATRTWNAAAEATIRTFHLPPSSGAYQPLPLTY
ncbi:MAG: penicillin-binding protein 2 [Leucobacter sp.]|nr:penicillin-binding protein 2 [Leucobacter sp.]